MQAAWTLGLRMSCCQAAHAVQKLTGNLFMSNVNLFLTKLHGTVTLVDETKIYSAQMPFSVPPDDPNAGTAFDQANYVGRLNLTSIFTPLHIRWGLHPIVLSALTFSYISGESWESAMNFTLGVCYGVDDPSLRAILAGFKKSYEAGRTAAQDDAVTRIFANVDVATWLKQMRTNVGRNFGILGIQSQSVRTEMFNTFQAESSEFAS